MDRTIVSLIGIVDSLDHILTTKGSATQDIALASQRLQNLRHELLVEGMRHAEVIGGAVDIIDGTVLKMQGLFTGQRPLEWALSGLQYVQIQDVELPPPPITSSSSSGPQDAGPLGVVEADVMTTAEVRAATTAAAKASTAAASMRRLRRLAVQKLQRDGQKAGQV